MSIKKILKEEFNDKQKLIEYRFKSSKFMFIIMAFLFFLNLILSGALINISLFQYSIPILYVLLILSLMIFLFFYIQKKYKIASNKNYIISALLFILFLVFLYPVIFR